jgi:hypothetical protein
MDMGPIMDVMRDPAGVPAPPQVFQALMVLTWSFHIAFVHMTFGAAAVAIYGFYRRGAGPHWEPLSMAMTKAAKVGVSMLIVLGVAPLLFTQVIYDPQWYTASVLSARWLIVFIFTLIIGYCAWFVFYYSNKPGARRRLGVFAILGLGLFLLDGLIMHTLAYQSLLPEQWMHWYAPNGVVDTRGAALHAIQWPRFLFMIGLSVPAAGVFLLAYADYFAGRPDRSPEYLDWVRALGRRVGVFGVAVCVLLLLAWQISHPPKTYLIAHPLGWLLLAALIGLGIWLWRAQRAAGYPLVVANLGLLGVLAVWREVIRIRYLRPFGYDIANYPMHLDLPSTALFFLTLAGVGGLVGGFFIATLYQAGRVQGVYTASRSVSRLGTAAVAVLALWIAVFFAYGITIWVRHAFTL